MLNRYLEYREMKQLRKDHLAKQRLRQLSIFLSIITVLLVFFTVMEMITPAKPTKTDTAVAKPANSTPVPQFTPESTPSGPSLEDQEEAMDIENFADAVTKPLEDLTPEDLDLIDAKGDDPCYKKNVMLPHDEMIEEIMACKHL